MSAILGKLDFSAIVQRTSSPQERAYRALRLAITTKPAQTATQLSRAQFADREAAYRQGEIDRSIRACLDAIACDGNIYEREMADVFKAAWVTPIERDRLPDRRLR